MQSAQIRAEWYIPGQVIYTAGWGEMTKELFAQYLTDMYTMIESADESSRPLIHVISDFSKIRKQIPMVEVVQVMRGFKPHPKTGWTITVGETSPINKMVSDIARQVAKVRQRTFDNFEDAVAFLHQVDDTLDWDKADDAALIRARPTAEELQT